MRRTFSTPRRHRSIPGHRQCPCGHIYSTRAMVCPVCHPLYDNQLTPVRPMVEAAGPVIAFHIPERTSPTYPDWLRQAAAECKLNSWSLLCVLGDPASTPLQVATAKAVLAVRSNEPVPADVDLTRVQTGYQLAKERSA